MKIKLKNIKTEDDIKFLYILLEERPTYANISHKQLPSYDQHKAFVNSNPYDIWFVLWNDNSRVGSIYKTKLGDKESILMGKPENHTESNVLVSNK